MWNLKKFKVFGGMTSNTQIELLDRYNALSGITQREGE